MSGHSFFDDLSTNHGVVSQMVQVLEVLQAGLRSPEPEAFVDRLESGK